MVQYASPALFRAFRGAGVEIHEYTRSELHAKVAVLDGVVASVGASNIAPVSLVLAREANVFVRDGRFASALRASLFEAIETAQQVPPLGPQTARSESGERWQRRRPRRRLPAPYPVSNC